jgi:hypothetical protein
MRRVKKGGWEVLRNASKAASLSHNSNKECLKENVRRINLCKMKGFKLIWSVVEKSEGF